MPSISAVPSSAAPPPAVAPAVAPPVVNEQPKNDAEVSEAAVSPPPEGIPQDLPVVSKEERIEYRDENGRVLNDDEVAELAGKVSFKTRYETRTRIVDAQGNEIYEGLVDAHGGAEEAGVAPPHPDVEGQNPETQEGAEAEASNLPPAVEVAEDQAKEQSVEQSVENEKNEAKPASEAQAATQD